VRDRRIHSRLVNGGLIVVAVVGLCVAGIATRPLASRLWRHERPPADNWAPVDRGLIRVIDGNTLSIGGERFRIEDIDAPLMPGHARCQREIELAGRARDFLFSRLASATVIEVTRVERDRYGRTLGRVRADGADLGDALMSAGLAQSWEGHRARWC